MQASRIANVSAAVLATGTTPAAPLTGQIEGLLERLFDETLWIGGAPPAERAVRHVPCAGGRGFVWGLATAIVAARGERVIVVGEGDPDGQAEILLALVAWPEAAVVVLEPSASGADRGEKRGEGRGPIGIFRRGDLEARAQALLAAGFPSPDFEGFVADLEVVRVPVARLGLSDAPIPLFAGPRIAPRIAS